MTTSLETPPTFAAWMLTQDHSPATMRNYRSDLKLFQVWFEQVNGTPLAPALLTSMDVREYRQYLLGVEQRKASTINRRLSALSAYSRWAQETGALQVNPTARVQAVKVQAQPPRWLEKKEQAAILRELELLRNAAETPVAHFRALRNETMVLVMLNTGLRLAELTGLVVRDVTLKERSGQVLVREGKGNKQRPVPLNREARRLLDLWLPARAVWLTELDLEQETLFLSQRGLPLGVRSVQRIVEMVGQRAGVRLTCHMLRHTFAKNLVNAGVTLEKVGALLGHSNLNTTRLYITPGQQDLERAVEALV